MTKAKFAVGSNMPGYMPDSEPHHATWAECKACLISDIVRDYDEIGADGSSLTHKQIDDLADYRGTIKRAKSLKRGHEFGETVANRHYWLSRV